METIVVFGAGKIGRSFVGQLFSRSGYEVVFVDVDRRIIDALNQRTKYEVVIKSSKDETIEVAHVRGVLATDAEAVKNALITCRLAATCVGKNALPKILPLIAQGIEKRFSEQPNCPLDIILAENVREACSLVKEGLRSYLPDNFPIDAYIGLVETSIGKMVPIMPAELEEKDPLLVYAEPYNNLILDKNGFKNPIPEVAGLSPKENIKAWVDRKAFIHNLGHAAAAYFGFYRYPAATYLHEVLNDPGVLSFVRQAMNQSAEALLAEYPGVFTENDLNVHIDDLLCRFQNTALGDTVFRVGSDLKRKLSSDDRVMGALHLARKHSLPFNRLQETLLYGLLFRAKDESGQYQRDDAAFMEEIDDNLDKVLTSICGLNHDSDLFRDIAYQYRLLAGKSTTE